MEGERTVGLIFPIRSFWCEKKSLCEFSLLSSLQSQIGIILGCQVRQDTTHRALRKASSTFVWMSVQYSVDFN